MKFLISFCVVITIVLLMLTSILNCAIPRNNYPVVYIYKAENNAVQQYVFSIENSLDTQPAGRAYLQIAPPRWYDRFICKQHEYYLVIELNGITYSDKKDVEVWRQQIVDYTARLKEENNVEQRWRELEMLMPLKIQPVD